MAALDAEPDQARWREEPRPLTAAERERLASLLSARHVRCPVCRGRRFEIGNVLYLGFLFADASLDEYLVALTCDNPACPAPRTGVRLRERQFRRV